MNTPQICPECGSGMEKVRYPISGGSFQCKYQCFVCGFKLTNAIKFPPNFKELPLWNEDLYDTFLQRQRQEREIKKQGHCLADYYAYLESEQWQKKRKEVLVRCKGICESCHKAAVTEVHHITYDNLGHENLWELLGTCRLCHAKIHGKDFE